MKPHNNPISIAGSVFVFHKLSSDEWTNPGTPIEIKATTNVIDLGRNGTYIRGNRIFAGTPFSNSGHGNVFIYHDPGGTFRNPVLEAALSAVPGGAIWMDNLVVTDAGIFVSGTTADAGMKIFFYQKPADDIWTDALPSCLVDPDGDGQTVHYNFIRLAATSTGLFAIFRGPSGVSLAKLTEGATGWCSPSVEVIETRASSRYGTLIQGNENDDVITGFVNHPWNNLSISALNAYSRESPEVWTSSQLYSTALSTRGHGYGHALAVKDDIMFVTAPFDNSVKERKGKVYVYHKPDHESPWVKIAQINPPAGMSRDAGFGSAVATNGDYLAVGAQGWQPSRILIYRKGPDGWGSPEFLQEIEVPVGVLTEATYGESVAMDERWLLIPFVDQRGFSMMEVAVYEMADGNWTYRQTLATDYVGIFTGTPNGGVAISGNTIVAANRVYQLDQNGAWQQRCILSPSDPQSLAFRFPAFEMISNGSNFGRSVAIRENTIVIGAPRQDSFTNGHIWDVGAVYVYTKDADEPWTDRKETARIVPDETDASSLFGWMVAFVDQAVLIGAPTAATLAKPDPGENPKNYAQGKAYLFQPDDPSWKNKSLTKTFSGETAFRDNFGIQVMYAGGRIFIGASEEDIATGRTSGSVYITDAPAIIRPVEPLCAESADVTLSSGQPGGIWSGRGIRNGVTGEFSPSLAGPGVHEITYVTGPCQRSTTMNIRVSPAINASIQGADEVFVCASLGTFSRTLYASVVPDASYEWFYRANADANFGSLPQGSTDRVTVSQRGQYQVRFYNEGCEDYSETVEIKDETVGLIVAEPEEVCGTPPGGLQLTAIPAGGSWSGTGVIQNRFLIDGVADGNHVLEYQYTSRLGCRYTKQTILVVKRIPSPVIQRTGHLCESGRVSLTMLGTILDGAEYTWSYTPSEGGGYRVLANGPHYEATTWGAYKLDVRKGDCHATSASLLLADAFSAVLTPPEEKAELCYDHDLRLGYPADELSTFEWYYSSDRQSPTMLDEHENSLRPDRTGYYTGVVRRGICSFTGPMKFFYIHRKDSVFVPNVFTPNGDGKNDSFSIIIFNQDDDPADGDAQDNVHYEIFNRYGRSVFAAPQNQPWSGANVDSGVYFWSGRHQTCQGESRAIKGIVHVVK